jgi:hypothetical protein
MVTISEKKNRYLYLFGYLYVSLISANNPFYFHNHAMNWQNHTNTFKAKLSL